MKLLVGFIIYLIIFFTIYQASIYFNSYFLQIVSCIIVVVGWLFDCPLLIGTYIMKDKNSNIKSNNSTDYKTYTNESVSRKIYTTVFRNNPQRYHFHSGGSSGRCSYIDLGTASDYDTPLSSNSTSISHIVEVDLLDTLIDNIESISHYKFIQTGKLVTFTCFSDGKYINYKKNNFNIYDNNSELCIDIYNTTCDFLKFNKFQFALNNDLNTFSKCSPNKNISNNIDMCVSNANKKSFDSSICEPLVTKEYIKKLSWRKFEKFIAKLFSENGYTTTVTPSTSDGGKDVIAKKNGVTYFIECKHYSTEKIGRPYLQKLIGAAAQYGVYNVIFVTTSEYHENAYKYEKDLNNNGSGFKLQLYGMKEILKLANANNKLLINKSKATTNNIDCYENKTAIQDNVPSKQLDVKEILKTHTLLYCVRENEYSSNMINYYADNTSIEKTNSFKDNIIINVTVRNVKDNKLIDNVKWTFFKYKSDYWKYTNSLNKANSTTILSSSGVPYVIFTFCAKKLNITISQKDLYLE